MQDNQDMTNNFHQAVKTKKDPCKAYAFGAEKTKFLKNFKKILRFFEIF